MITYDPLWKTMKEKNISQYRLVKAYGFSAGQLNRLKNNQYVSTHTIGVLCTILECSVEDIMEFRMDKSEGLYPIMETVLQTTRRRRNGRIRTKGIRTRRIRSAMLALH